MPPNAPPIAAPGTAPTPAKNAPTIHEKIIGNPNPPRKPVFAGFISSIASMPGSAVNLINRIPEIFPCKHK